MNIPCSMLLKWELGLEVLVFNLVLMGFVVVWTFPSFLGFNFCGDLLTSPRNGSLSLDNVALNPSLKRTSSLKRSKCSSLLDSGKLGQ